MAKGELVIDTNPKLSTYEGKVFPLEGGSNLRVDEISYIRRSDAEPRRSVTVNIDIVDINGLVLRDVTIVTEFKSEEALRSYLSKLRAATVTSADVVDAYANTTQDPEKAIAELIRDNSDLGMFAKANVEG